MLKLVWATALSVSVAIGVCSADELKPPLEPSQDVGPDPAPGAGCPLSKPAQVVKAKLVVRNSLRNDVGPYSVTLPGYATDGTQESYRPFLIKAKPGDTLRIDLVNQLDAEKPKSRQYRQSAYAWAHCRAQTLFSLQLVGRLYLQLRRTLITNQGGLPLKYRIDIPETIQGPEAVQCDRWTSSRQVSVPQRSLLVPLARPRVGQEPRVCRADGHPGHRSEGRRRDIRVSRRAPTIKLPGFARYSAKVPPGQTPDKFSSAPSAPIPADGWIFGRRLRHPGLPARVESGVTGSPLAFGYW